MSLIHTIKLAKERHMTGTVSATRTSASRKYVACLVVTVTERSIAIQAAERAKIEAELVTWKKTLEERMAKHGMTVAEAETHHKEVSDRWFNNEDGLFPTSERIRKERNATYLTNIDGLAKADLVKRGFEDPFDKEGRYGVCEAASEVERRERTLAAWKPQVLGEEGVLSWHMSVPNATKSDASHWTAKGYTVSVRTDIEVRETAKRAKKAV